MNLSDQLYAYDVSICQGMMIRSAAQTVLNPSRSAVRGGVPQTVPGGGRARHRQEHAEVHQRNIPRAMISRWISFAPS